MARAIIRVIIKKLVSAADRDYRTITIKFLYKKATREYVIGDTNTSEVISGKDRAYLLPWYIG